MRNVESILTSFQNSSIDEVAVNDLMCSLINDYVLNVNGKIYNFCEIELYYYKKDKHEDCGVLKRDKNAGDIFFHRYGFDICFASKKDEYGGILIRSLKKDDKYILGPLRSFHTLLNRYQPNIQISIDECKDKKNHQICKTVRVKSLCKENKYNPALYRYVTKDACIDIQNNNENKEYLKKIQEKICNGEKKKNNE